MKSSDHQMRAGTDSRRADPIAEAETARSTAYRMDPDRLPHRLLCRRLATIQRAAPKKIWIKQIADDLRNRRVDLDQARIIAIDGKARKSVVNKVRKSAALTASYTGCAASLSLQSPARDQRKRRKDIFVITS